MKYSISRSVVVLALVANLGLNLFAADSPGKVEFARLGAPGKGGKYVEVNVGRNLIAIAARLVDKQQPEAAQLLRSVELVRVNVCGMSDDTQVDTTKRVHDLRETLDKQGWERIVMVQEQENKDVGIFIKVRGEEALEGVVVTVLDGQKKEAVFINVVGDIKPEQIASLGEALDIDPLKEIGGKMKKK